MTDTATPTPKADEAINVVLEEAGTEFAPRTRKATADALASLKPSLDAVQGNPDKVYTIVKGVTPAKAASLVSLLNERHDTKWTFGGRTAEDGKTALVQARYSTKPENARPVRKVTRRAPSVDGTGTGSGGKASGTPAGKTVKK